MRQTFPLSRTYRGYSLLYRIGLLSLVLVAAVSFAETSVNSHRNIKGLAVAIGSGNVWKTVPMESTALEARRDWTQKAWLAREGKKAGDWKNLGCRGILGDGWHVPSAEELKTDREDLSGSDFAIALGAHRFWLSNIETKGQGESRKTTHYVAASLKSEELEKIETRLAGKKQLVCVCGPNTTLNDTRRSTSQCLGFKEESATDKTPSEVEYYATRPTKGNEKGTPITVNFSEAMKHCKERGKRVPITEELARLNDSLQSYFKNEGCIWSSTPSGDEKFPREIFTFTGEQTGGVMNSVENRPCNVVCVL